MFNEKMRQNAYEMKILKRKCAADNLLVISW